MDKLEELGEAIVMKMMMMMAVVVVVASMVMMECLGFLFASNLMGSSHLVERFPRVPWKETAS